MSDNEIEIPVEHIPLDLIRRGLINVRRGHIIDANGDHWIRVPPEEPTEIPNNEKPENST